MENEKKVVDVPAEETKETEVKEEKPAEKKKINWKGGLKKVFEIGKNVFAIVGVVFASVLAIGAALGGKETNEPVIFNKETPETPEIPTSEPTYESTEENEI